MNNKKEKIIYLASTGLLTALMLFSAGMYFLNYPMVSETFAQLGFPTFIIYPLAIAKILGLVAIWSKKNRTLMEWAYAGFFFDLILAAGAHISINDGEYAAALAGIVLLLTSYFSEKKLASNIKLSS